MLAALERVRRAQRDGVASRDELVSLAADLRELRTCDGGLLDWTGACAWLRAQVDARGEGGLAVRLLVETLRFVQEERAWTLGDVVALVRLHGGAGDLMALGLPAPLPLEREVFVAVHDRIRRYERRELDEEGARLHAYAAFHARHPMASLPQRLQLILETRASRDDGHWRVRFVLPRFAPRGPEYSRDERGLLIHVDPTTGKRMCVLCDHPTVVSERELFRVRLDAQTAEASVELDFDPAALEPMDYWLPDGA